MIDCGLFIVILILAVFASSWIVSQAFCTIERVERLVRKLIELINRRRIERRWKRIIKGTK